MNNGQITTKIKIRMSDICGVESCISSNPIPKSPNEAQITLIKLGTMFLYSEISFAYAKCYKINVGREI